MVNELIHLENDIDLVRDIVVSDEDYVVVVFTAPEWCGPCRQYKKHYELVSTGAEETWVVYDLHYETDAQSRYGFSSVPTTIVFHNGEEVDRFSGALGAIPLKARIAQAKV
jgi:thioredoxin 1